MEPKWCCLQLVSMLSYASCTFDRGSESEILEEIEAVSLMEEVPVLHGNKGHLDQ